MLWAAFFFRRLATTRRHPMIETSTFSGIEAVIPGLAAHRHFARETDPPRV